MFFFFRGKNIVLQDLEAGIWLMTVLVTGSGCGVWRCGPVVDVWDAFPSSYFWPFIYRGPISLLTLCRVNYQENIFMAKSTILGGWHIFGKFPTVWRWFSLSENTWNIFFSQNIMAKSTPTNPPQTYKTRRLTRLWFGANHQAKPKVFHEAG